MYSTVGAHKRIERAIGTYIASRYQSCAEIGAGRNLEAALTILSREVPVFCTDLWRPDDNYGVPYVIDDLYLPDLSLYTSVEVIYAIRPAEEMVPALIRLAEAADCDLIVYHLGSEIYGDGGEILDSPVVLRRYHRSRKPSKRVF
ncbi:MAG: hypothetical protein LUQ61_02740 [Methanoregulaceae archaeon]|jgi:hypothetical protein|nr:hypothetical protein [Methanoregulaceae archaeon]